MSFKKPIIRKMCSVIFQLYLEIFSVYFEFSFSRFNFSKEKSGKGFCAKQFLKNFVYPGDGFFIHLFGIH